MEFVRASRITATSRRVTRRRLLAAAGTSGLALAVACGSRQGSTGSAKPSQSRQPKAGGRFNQAVKDDPPSFDPSTRFNITGQVLGMTSDRLLSWKTGSDVKYT